MPRRHAPDHESFAGKYGLQRFFNLGSLGKHSLPIHCAHVIEIDVYGEARDIEDKKVQGCAAL
jgi:hypothetical protein